MKILRHLGLQLTISEHCSSEWFVTQKVPSHYPNQCSHQPLAQLHYINMWNFKPINVEINHDMIQTWHKSVLIVPLLLIDEISWLYKVLIHLHRKWKWWWSFHRVLRPSMLAPPSRMLGPYARPFLKNVIDFTICGYFCTKHLNAFSWTKITTFWH